MTMSGLTSAIVGTTFGSAFDLALMNDPTVIRTQFSFSSFLMLRMFLSASVASTIAVHVLHIVDSKKYQPKPLSVLNNSDQVKKNIFGGALLGIGMFFSGSCPGTVWSQIGSFPNLQALFTVLGSLTGCILFSKLQDSGKLDVSCKVIPKESKPKQKSLNHLMPLVLTIGFLGVIFGVEKFAPWKSQLPKFLQNPGDVSNQVIDPAYAGVMIGIAQFISYYGNGCGLGSSSGWMYMVGVVSSFIGYKSKTLQQASKSEVGKKQAITALFITVGSYIIQHYLQQDILRVSRGVSVTQVDLIQSFLGGVLILLGARIAGGCTSGHGLTGIANINPLSFVTVAAMFGGGILVSFIF